MKPTGLNRSRSAMANPRMVIGPVQWFLIVFFSISLLLVHAANPEIKTILFLGDSLTAGYGLDPDEAYPAFVQKKIEAAQLPWRVVNAGLSGDTTAGGLRRLDWVLRQQVSIVVIELGANDGLRGIAPDLTETNLQKIIEAIRHRVPDVTIVLAGMRVPTNLGPEHTQRFAAIYPKLAKEYKVALIPFLLEGVGGHPELNQADGTHPTAEGQAILAANVWAVIEPLLRNSSAVRPTR